jgi:propionyl-CoA synthetase
LKNELQIQTGDRVIIYCPHIPEAIVAMLACTRIGAVHSVVFGGFAAPELAARIRDCRPKVVIAASSAVERSRVIPYKPLVDRAIELAELPQKPTCVVIQRENVGSCELGPNDVDYNELMGRARPVEALPVPSIHPHYVLYTSGTTGLPKGILRDTGSYAVALKYSMSAFYDTNPGETFWAASDIGWVVGHSYIVYAPLLHGCTTVLYEGKPVGTPDAGAFWRVIEEHQVKTLFAAPTAFRAIKQADPLGKFVQKHDLSCFKYLFLAGEHCDPATLNWCERAMGEYGDIPVIDHW